MGEVRVGTSGWSYPEWVGRFYPNGTSTARMLSFYGRRFDTVEAHSTYRRLPTATTLIRWTEELPPDFKVVPKAHMGITHRRDLDGIDERMAAFGESLVPLGKLLGPVFFSFPHLEPDLDRLDRVLGALGSCGLEGTTLGGKPALAAFELGPRWHTPEVIDRLERAGVTLVVTDDDAHDGMVAPMPGPFVYVRLRKTRYNRSALDAWAQRLGDARDEGRDVYAFLKHDDFANGPRWARRLAAALRAADLPAGHLPRGLDTPPDLPAADLPRGLDTLPAQGGSTIQTSPRGRSALGQTAEGEPSTADRQWVQDALGRPPMGAYLVAARDSRRRPSVICNSPILDDGTPMPTRWWLVDPDLRRIVSTLEAGGGVRAAERAVDPEELAEAHARYEQIRDAAIPSGHPGPRPHGGVGGTRKGVKCLHAHYAWHLAGGNDPVGRWVAEQLGSTPLRGEEPHTVAGSGAAGSGVADLEAGEEAT